MSNPFLRRLALLSVGAAVATIAMKGVAYAVTGSAGLLSDALESLVNLVAAATAYLSLWYASRPADATHAYGHEKIEFFASGLEGMLILVAGLGAIGIAIDRLIHPHELTSLGLGTLLSGAAAVINGVVAFILLNVGRRHRSIVLEADGQHLMADVWTTAGVLAGLGLVALTGWLWIDPILAIAVGLHIFLIGGSLIRRSFNGLMDHSLPAAEVLKMREVIAEALPDGTAFHALRTRQAGRRTFVEFHLLVPGVKSVRDAHTLAHQVEDKLSVPFPDLHVTIHIEPIDEKTSWEVTELKQLGELVEGS